MSEDRALLLFDIDGTLLQQSAEAHKDAIHEALRSVYGVADPTAHRVDAAGKTDLEIAREILVSAGVPDVEFGARADEFRVAAAEEYAARCPKDLSDRVAPGMGELLHYLAERSDVLLSLVTGNLEPIARLKLKRAGLGDYFDRNQGAFGSDDEDRAALPAIARERAGSANWPHPRERTWVIGDTPRDIACARADAHALREVIDAELERGW